MFSICQHYEAAPFLSDEMDDDGSQMVVSLDVKNGTFSRAVCGGLDGAQMILYVLDQRP